MRKYIMFYNQQKGALGYEYIPYVKYVLKEESPSCFLVLSDKIYKDNLSPSEYQIGAIEEMK